MSDLADYNLNRGVIKMANVVVSESVTVDYVTKVYEKVSDLNDNTFGCLCGIMTYKEVMDTCYECVKEIETADKEQVIKRGEMLHLYHYLVEL